MTDELQRLEDWVEPLIRQLSPAQRRTLARRVARDLRRSQQQRIREQRNPDGSAYEPRQASQAQGRIRRRAMFRRLRTARYMKVRSTPQAAEVGFSGRVARIARVHQKGLRARVAPDGPRYDYPQRQLLGYASEDQALIRDSVLHHLEEGKL